MSTGWTNKRGNRLCLMQKPLNLQPSLKKNIVIKVAKEKMLFRNNQNIHVKDKKSICMYLSLFINNIKDKFLIPG